MSNPSTKAHVHRIEKPLSKEGIAQAFTDKCKYALAKDQYTATHYDNYLALAMAIRDRVVERWVLTQQRYHNENAKRVYYLSMEFLIGRLMGNFVYNLDIEKEVAAAMKDLGLDLDEIRGQELDAGLGNGGLGRLAACFLDSMATLGIPAHGYGIRYDYGIFKQQIRDGYQVEMPEEWLRLPNPWEFARPEYTVRVRFYGRTEGWQDDKFKFHTKWVDTEDVLAVPYDVPVPGYNNGVVNTLRLWSARSTNDFDLNYFNGGDYTNAVYGKIQSESISKVLYPNDNSQEGKELRLKQEYFFTAAAMADILRRYKSENKDLRKLHEKAAVQLNDTHPTLAIVELMRVLVDDERMEWGAAWEITRKVFAYTNHTLLPEALECWDLKLFEKVLPRHLSIIYEINARFLEDVATRYPGDVDRLRNLSIIDESHGRRVRMAHIAVVGSHSVNGVSALHSELIKQHLFRGFHEMTPEKFNNKTNGITQRRWLLKSNPRLSRMIHDAIGDAWITDLTQLKKLEPLVKDAGFRKKWHEARHENKKHLAEYIERTQNLTIDPDSLFDVQVKRIHEYKRQLLFSFYALSEFLRLRSDTKAFVQPRTFIFGGKAAPGYAMAKLIIKFINSVGELINNDPLTKGRLRLVFMENYCVSVAEKIFPASDLSEQISTAGTEASGTGNMKFMLNGALTIGTLDGANIEMAEEAGADNIFIFGLKTEEVRKLKEAGYRPQDFIRNSPMLSEIMELIRQNVLSPHQPDLFRPILDSLSGLDPYLICADFEAYCAMQERVSAEYQKRDAWVTKSILNTARSGKFSSDRTIREYAKDIWKVSV
jgi:starch phosphorylase